MNQAPPSGGLYKIGNPYQVEGTWYYPAVDYNYSETGIASWYGPNFHGKYTANGEPSAVQILRYLRAVRIGRSGRIAAYSSGDQINRVVLMTRRSLKNSRK